MTETNTTRVLVVDDEPSILELLRTALVALGGYDVETAGSGVQALEMLGQGRPHYDLVLLDIQMPEMNGVDVCARIRGMAGYRDIPIIMLTAMSQMEYVDKAFLAGATDYVTKPFNFEDLRNRMANGLRTSELKDSEATAQAELEPLEGRLREKKPKYETKVEFPDYSRFLKTERFDNYVRQMAGSRAPYTSAFAVKISNGYYLHRALSGDAFLACLRDVAALLAEVTEKNGSLISYRGQGVFLCVEYGTRLSNTEEIEQFLNTEIAILVEKTSRPKIVVSPHAELKRNDRAAAKHLMKDAISKVESRNAQKMQPKKPLADAGIARHVVRKHVLTPSQQAGETRAYKDILSSMLGGK